MQKIPAPYPVLKQKNIIYLDNNGTTMLCNVAKNSIIKWLTARSNPSADSLLANKAKDLITFAEQYVLKHIGSTKYTVIFTSGASESNSFILRSTVESFRRWKGVKPHIITSTIEHKSVLDCCKFMEESGMATVSYVNPNVYGFILPSQVEKILKEKAGSVALVSIMAANNELGTINKYSEIGEIAHKYNVPFHTDAVQLFGKYVMKLANENIDALSMSFHKLYGPMGIGMLLLKNEFVEGYKLNSQIFGSQQKALRGGTENVPLVAGAIAAMWDTFKNRSEKNKHMLTLKNAFVKSLERNVPKGNYVDYFNEHAKSPKSDEFIILGCPSDDVGKCLPNTLLLSFAKNSATSPEDYFCNVKLKKALDAKKIIVSVGSACNTSSAKASHVLYAIKAPDVIKRGVIRISLSDNSRKKDMDELLSCLVAALRSQKFKLDK